VSQARLNTRACLLAAPASGPCEWTGKGCIIHRHKDMRRGCWFKCLGKASHAAATCPLKVAAAGACGSTTTPPLLPLLLCHSAPRCTLHRPDLQSSTGEFHKKREREGGGITDLNQEAANKRWPSWATARRQAVTATHGAVAAVACLPACWHHPLISNSSSSNEQRRAGAGLHQQRPSEQSTPEEPVVWKARLGPPAWTSKQ